MAYRFPLELSHPTTQAIRRMMHHRPETHRWSTPGAREIVMECNDVVASARPHDQWGWLCKMHGFEGRQCEGDAPNIEEAVDWAAGIIASKLARGIEGPMCVCGLPMWRLPDWSWECRGFDYPVILVGCGARRD